MLSEQDHPITISEMLKDERLSAYSNQKMSALLRQMGEEGTKEVRKIKDKKVSLFEVAEADDDVQYLDREVTV